MPETITSAPGESRGESSSSTAAASVPNPSPSRSSASWPIGRVGERADGWSLEEADPVVEQAEAGEAVAHQVQVAGQRRARACSLAGLGPPSPGAVARKGSAIHSCRSVSSCASRVARSRTPPPPPPDTDLGEVARDPAGQRAGRRVAQPVELGPAHRR